MFQDSIQKLVSFRKKIHELIPSYRDATMDLIDALSTNENAGSVTQLSNNRFFRRQYSSLTKVIRYFLVENKKAEDETDQQEDPAPIDKPVEKDLRPSKEIQQAIGRQIAKLCAYPKQRNFFYSPAMSHRQ